MIEIDIPSVDPIQHEVKLFMGLTSRQCICIVPALALGIGGFVTFKDVNTDLAVLALIICIVPAFLLGWAKPYNMKFEQFVKLWYFNTMVANPKRIYKTDSEVEIKKSDLRKSSLNKKKSKQSDSAMPAEGGLK